MGGKEFNANQNVNCNVTDDLNEITLEDFQGCSQQLKEVKQV
jgi:hypothetical protein